MITVEKKIAKAAIIVEWLNAFEESLNEFFMAIDTNFVTDLYESILNEIEPILLKSTLNHTKHNQCKSSVILGLSRSTLRKKMKKHGLLKSKSS